MKSLDQASIFNQIAAHATTAGISIPASEIASLAASHGFTSDQLEAIETVFTCLGHYRQTKRIETLLRLSRLPKTNPKTFDTFDFSRISVLTRKHSQP